MIRRRGHDRLIIVIIYRYYHRRRYRHRRFSSYAQWACILLEESG